MIEKLKSRLETRKKELEYVKEYTRMPTNESSFHYAMGRTSELQDEIEFLGAIIEGNNNLSMEG